MDKNNIKQIGSKQYLIVNKKDLKPDVNVLGYILHFNNKRELQQCEIRPISKLIKSLIFDYIYIETKNIYIGVISINIIYVSLITLLIGTLCLGGFVINNKINDYYETVTDIHMNICKDMTMNCNALLPFYNDKNNKVDLIYEIRNEDGVVIFHTEKLLPGQMLEWDTTNALKKGKNILEVKVIMYDMYTGWELDTAEYTMSITLL